MSSTYLDQPTRTIEARRLRPGREVVLLLAVALWLLGAMLAGSTLAGVVLAAALVLVPRLLPAALAEERLPVRLSTTGLTLGAAPLVVAFALPTGPLGALLALPWVAVLATIGLSLLRPFASAAPSIIRRRDAVAVLAYASVAFGVMGAFFIVFYRAGVRPLDLPTQIVLLTAVHYHVAGVLLAGQAVILGRRQPGRLATVAAALLLVGMPTTALAFITSSALVNGLGATITAAAGLAVAGLAVREIGRTDTARWALVLLAAALAISMPLALAFGLAPIAGISFIDVDAMVRTHGLLNTLGVGLAGTYAVLARPANPTTIELVTRIRAPAQVVFDLARDLDLHQRSMAHTGEVAIAGRRRGKVDVGDTVTWRARHLGRTWTLQSVVVTVEAPTMFVDVQGDVGPFASFRHEHRFAVHGTDTVMTDRWTHVGPLGTLGRLADRLFLARYMRRLLERRNDQIKLEAEAQASEAVG